MSIDNIPGRAGGFDDGEPCGCADCVGETTTYQYARSDQPSSYWAAPGDPVGPYEEYERIIREDARRIADATATPYRLIDVEGPAEAPRMPDGTYVVTDAGVTSTTAGDVARRALEQ